MKTWRNCLIRVWIGNGNIFFSSLTYAFFSLIFNGSSSLPLLSELNVSRNSPINDREMNRVATSRESAMVSYFFCSRKISTRFHQPNFSQKILFGSLSVNGLENICRINLNQFMGNCASPHLFSPFHSPPLLLPLKKPKLPQSISNYFS